MCLTTDTDSFCNSVEKEKEKKKNPVPYSKNY